MPCRASLDIDHALAALEMKHIEAHLLARTEGLIDDLAVLDCERVMAVAFILKAVPLLAPLVLAVQQTCQCAGTSSACMHAMPCATTRAQDKLYLYRIDGQTDGPSMR